MRATFAATLAFVTVGASAQSTDPMIFVANNGNLEGSVSAMRYNPDGSLALVDRVITGSRASTSDPCTGCNAYAISRSPSGRFLATTHASGQLPEDYTIFEVAPDGTLSIVTSLTLPQAGLDLDWVTDDLLATAVTNLGGTNELRLYDFDAGLQTLTLADSDAAGSFLTSVAVHPSGSWIVTNDSFGFTLRLWSVTGSSATLVNTIAIPVYGVSVEFSPDGRFLYAAGGISSGGRAFSGLLFDSENDNLIEVPGSPFTSPGQSPKGFAFSTDGSLLFVSHGTDATIQVFSLDPVTGEATSLGQSFDVGLQGTLQGMDSLDGVLFALDNSTAIDGIQGAYAFGVDAMTGQLTPGPNSPLLTGGIGANDVASWPGTACVGDIADDFGSPFPDGMVSFGDFLFLLGLVGPCGGGTGNPSCFGDIADDFGTLGGDGMVSFGDFLALLGLVGPCP